MEEEARIRRLIDKSKTFAESGDFEGQSEWSKYICILCAGYIENFVKDAYINYANRSVSMPISTFISSILVPLRNPKSEKICEITGRFKSDWQNQLTVYMYDDGRGDAIDSIMNNRHLIAHGKSNEVRLTMINIIKYFDKSIEIANFIYKLCS